MPLPSQEGKDRPYLELNNQQYTLTHQGAAPQIASAPQPSVAPQPSTAPQPTATPMQAPTPMASAPDQLAMLTTRPTPPPVATPAPESRATAPPQQPNSAYRPERQKNQIAGRISNRGISSVNALGTPLGRYQKFLFDSIGSYWYASVGRDTSLYGVCTVTLSFHVDRNGKIQNLKVIDKSSGEAFVNLCLASVLQAKPPPMPDDLAATLPPDGLDVQVPFTIFPN
jgi:outer membrane biosynthesis protein TonB